MTALDVLREILDDARRLGTSDADAMRQVVRLVAQNPPDGSPAAWSYERTEAGWTVRDENGAVATLADPEHRREDDAVQIVHASRRSSYFGEVAIALRSVVARLEAEAEGHRTTIRIAVQEIERDTRDLTALIALRGADPVSTARLDAHVRELREAQADLDQKRRTLHALAPIREVIEG